MEGSSQSKYWGNPYQQNNWVYGSHRVTPAPLGMCTKDMSFFGDLTCWQVNQHLHSGVGRFSLFFENHWFRVFFFASMWELAWFLISKKINRGLTRTILSINLFPRKKIQFLGLAILNNLKTINFLHWCSQAGSQILGIVVFQQPSKCPLLASCFSHHRWEHLISFKFVYNVKKAAILS